MKRKFLQTSILFLALGSVFPMQAQNLDSLLRIYHNFDSTMLDVTLPFYDGTPINIGYDTSVIPSLQQSTTFNGNSYIQLEDEALNDYDTITVALWFKSTASTPSQFLQGILSMQNSAVPATPSNSVPTLYIDNVGLLRGTFWTASTSSVMSSQLIVTTGKWFHAALVAAGNKQWLYLNGVAVDSLTRPINIRTDLRKVTLGAAYTVNWPNSGVGYRYLRGAMDEFRVYNRNLSASEVDSLYKLTSPTNPPTVDSLPLGFNLCTGDTNTIVLNATGNNLKSIWTRTNTNPNFVDTVAGTTFNFPTNTTSDNGQYNAVVYDSTTNFAARTNAFNVQFYTSPGFSNNNPFTSYIGLGKNTARSNQPIFDPFSVVEWFKDGVRVDSGNGFLAFNNFQPSDTGEYRLRITSPFCGTVTSEPITIKIDIGGYFPFDKESFSKNEWVPSKALRIVPQTYLITQDRFGNDSSAVDYFGSQSILIDIPTYPQFINMNTDFTISAWVNIQNFRSGPQLIISGTRDEQTSNFIGGSFLQFNSSSGASKGSFEGGSFYGNSSFGGAAVTTGAIIDTGLWYHVAMVRKDDTLRMYLDSTEVDMAPITDSVSEGARYFTFGGRYDRTPSGSTVRNHLDGFLDEIRLMDSAATLATIQAWANGPKTLSNTSQIKLLDKWEAYPNPSNDLVNIRFEDAKTRIIRLFSAEGTTVRHLSFEGEEIQIDLQNLPRGPYLIHVVEGQRQGSRVLIIE